MMANCLANLLLLAAKVCLLTYRNEYTFDCVEYALVMYKVIMRLATIDSIATTQTLRDNLQNLMVFAAMVSGDMIKSTQNLTVTTHRFWLEGQQLTIPSTSCSTPTSSCPATTSNPT